MGREAITANGYWENMGQGSFIPSRSFSLTLPLEEEIQQGDHGNVAGNLQAPASLLAAYRLRTGPLSEGIVLNCLNTWSH